MALLPLLNQLKQEPYLSIVLHPYGFSLGLISVLLFLIRMIRSSSRGEIIKLPPSPPSLPFIGNLHQLGTHPHRSLRALSDKYGPLMLLHLGCVPTLVVSSADLAREIVKKHDIVFSNRPQTTAGKILLYGCQDPAFSPYGEYWRQVRKICVLELLSLRRVQQFQFVRAEEAVGLVDRIRRACLRSKTTENYSIINLTEMLVTTSNNVISRCALGQALGEDDDVGGLLRNVMIYFTAFCLGDFFPSLRWVDVVRGFIGLLEATFRGLDRFFELVIEERKRTIQESDGGAFDTKDFLDILLRLQKDALLGFELTQDNIKAILLDMFIGGTDTTSGALEWIMAELLKNPRTTRKVQAEVRSVVGKKVKIDNNDIKQMVYLKCVVKETLRLHPLAPLLAPRETTQGVEIEGYHIPAKTRVLVNSWAIQRNPSLWDKPEEFIPERFENNPIDFEGHDFEFIPFGIGRRGCPGLKFADANVEYIIASLLYWFDWKLSDDGASPEDLDMSEVYGLTVHKKVPLHVVPIPYSP